jgi:hypothetical protein
MPVLSERTLIHGISQMPSKLLRLYGLQYAVQWIQESDPNKQLALFLSLFDSTFAKVVKWVDFNKLLCEVPPEDFRTLMLRFSCRVFHREDDLGEKWGFASLGPGLPWGAHFLEGWDPRDRWEYLANIAREVPEVDSLLMEMIPGHLKQLVATGGRHEVFDVTLFRLMREDEDRGSIFEDQKLWEHVFSLESKYWPSAEFMEYFSAYGRQDALAKTLRDRRCLGVGWYLSQVVFGAEGRTIQWLQHLLTSMKPEVINRIADDKKLVHFGKSLGLERGVYDDVYLVFQMIYQYSSCPTTYLSAMFSPYDAVVKFLTEGRYDQERLSWCFQHMSRETAVLLFWGKYSSAWQDLRPPKQELRGWLERCFGDRWYACPTGYLFFPLEALREMLRRRRHVVQTLWNWHRLLPQGRTRGIRYLPLSLSTWRHKVAA